VTLVLVSGCPDCRGDELHESTQVEEPLLIGGGYGEARATTRRSCPCGWSLKVRVESLRPR
jgi:hypothetical protein